jgi:hypothetical protein
MKPYHKGRFRPTHRVRAAGRGPAVAIQAGMKKYIPVVAVTSAIGMILLGSSCSTFSSKKSGEDIASNGPTILTVKADPSTVDLDQNLRPKENSMVFADVKDFQSNVRNVHLRFIHVPLDIPMKRVAGTTWQGELTPAQLKELAVSGQTMRYQANVIATNESGQTGVSASPVDISVRAPEPKQLSGVAGNDQPRPANDESTNSYQRNQQHVDENNTSNTQNSAEGELRSPTHSNANVPSNGSNPNQPGISGQNTDATMNDTYNKSQKTYPATQGGDSDSSNQQNQQ